MYSDELKKCSISSIKSQIYPFIIPNEYFCFVVIQLLFGNQVLKHWLFITACSLDLFAMHFPSIFRDVLHALLFHLTALPFERQKECHSR